MTSKKSSLQDTSGNPIYVAVSADSHNHEVSHTYSDLDSTGDSEPESCKGFKHISDNIKEETLVASKAGLKV